MPLQVVPTGEFGTRSYSGTEVQARSQGSLLAELHDSRAWTVPSVVVIVITRLGGVSLTERDRRGATGSGPGCEVSSVVGSVILVVVIVRRPVECEVIIG